MTTYTPLFDDIVQNQGIVAAAVYGYIWRKCQLKRGVCDASLQTMADELNVSRRTIITHIKRLVNDGLIIDQTPDADRKPHKYLVQNLHQTRENSALHDQPTRENFSPTRENNSLALVQNLHQTRENFSPKDTGYNKEHIYIHPMPEKITDLITALSTATKTTYWPKTESDFEAAAHVLNDMGATTEDVSGFGRYWNDNGYYKGKPALKSLMGEFANYMQSKNGSAQDLSWLDDIPTFTEVD